MRTDAEPAAGALQAGGARARSRTRAGAHRAGAAVRPQEEAAETAWEKQEEAQESIEAAQRVGDAVRAAKLVPLAEAAGKEFEVRRPGLGL